MTRKPNGFGRSLTAAGYLRVPGAGKSILQHRAVAAKILGRPLSGGEEVHHWDENKLNNAPENLVICPSRAYHMLIHQRIRAFDACGHADWLHCTYCKEYRPAEEFSFRPRGKNRPNGVQWNHAQCPTPVGNVRRRAVRNSLKRSQP